MSLFDLPAPPPPQEPDPVTEPQPVARCRRCKRKITDPESLAFGIGEDCRERLGIPPPKTSPRIGVRWTGPVDGQQDLINERGEMTTIDDRPARMVRLDMDALDEAAKLGPLYLSDGDGELQIWRESALLDIKRDEDGEIVGYRTPGCYKATDLVAEWDLDGWDEGEGDSTDDSTDDETRRKAAEAFVTAINSLPAQLEAGRNLGKTIDMFAEVMRSAIRQSRTTGAEAGMAVILDFAEEMPELLEGLDEADTAGAGQ